VPNCTIHFSFNICTGIYPFEGDNIYRLLENIGKGVWQVPDGLDPVLADLLVNMLRFDPVQRFSIQQIRTHSWFLTAPPDTGDAVPIPPLKGDSLRNSTVLPYLVSYHYDDHKSDVYFTEHELNNGKIYLISTLGYDLKLNHICRRTSKTAIDISAADQRQLFKSKT